MSYTSFRGNGGDEEDRTPYPLLARQVLSQMSYTPTCRSLLLLSHVSLPLGRAHLKAVEV